jgi:hypothetical protein
MAEAELAQADELRVDAARPPCRGECVLEERVGGGEARVARIHGSSREAEHPWRRAVRLRVFLEQVQLLVLDEPARKLRRRGDVHPVLPLLHAEDGDLLLVIALGAAPGDDAVLPPVPGADDVLVAHAALAERSALVVARVSDRAKTTLVKEDRDRVAVGPQGAGNPREELLPRPEAVPGGHLASGTRVALRPIGGASIPTRPVRHHFAERRASPLF